VDGAPTAPVRARRILIIANPAAGTTRGSRPGEAAAAAASRAGRSVTLEHTRQPGDAQRIAASAASAGFDLIVAAGGDGTVNEAANGLMGSGAALGVAPAGTMNLLARILNLPLDPAQAVLRVIDGFHPLAIRPGTAGGRSFLLMLGSGFDAWVLRELLRGVSGKIGFGDYVRGALRGLATFPFPHLSIDHDGETTDGHTALVGRAPLYGGFLRPTPNARLERDALELCAIDGDVARLTALLPRLWSGAHRGCPGVTLCEARRVSIRASIGDVPYQVDGEIAGTLPVVATLSERILVLASPRRIP
jgi:diacylglycerol kinase (ATP)